MSQIEITQVRSRAERDAFIKFPWRIYKNDPAWVPPLLIERKEFLDREKHPFYQHGDAALFLARSGGEIVGRIMASDDPRYNALHKTNVGCFGLFECVDDSTVAAALLAAAEAWVLARGRSEIMGPIDYSTNYVCALLIDGFQHPPTILTSHNPPYYARLIEASGFTKAKDWYAWLFQDFSRPTERLRKIATARAGKHGVTIRPVNPKKIVEESQHLHAIYDQAWEKNWGFVPFTRAESEHMAREMKLLIPPRGILIAEIEKKPVGFAICIPDINVALRHINGRLTWFGLPIGLSKLLYYRRKIRLVRFIALGVVEKYRRAGIAETLVLQMMDEVSKSGSIGELSMTLEDNFMVNRFVEALGAEKSSVPDLSTQPGSQFFWRTQIMADGPSLRRVLIVADESADWMVAGLRQLDRLALAVDEFAGENKETVAPVLVCIFWRPDLDPSQRWVPKHKRLTGITFTTEVDGQPYDCFLNTRLFLYRRAMRQLFEASVSPNGPVTSSDAMASWKEAFACLDSLPRVREGAWEYIADRYLIDAVEARFLRSSGKSQDGPVSRYLNRPISRAVTRLLLRFPIAPNGWTLLISPIPIVAALVLARGNYGSFVLGMILFQVFSVLDGCDGEIARAKFKESERGRRLDEVFDILSNVWLVIGLGFGLSAQAVSAGRFGWIWTVEGIAAALLIGVNEFYLTGRTSTGNSQESETLGGTLYPRHRGLVERSGMLRLGKGFTHWVMQLTKHDVAVLGFLFLAVIGWPALILHLMFAVTAITLMLAVRSNRVRV